MNALRNPILELPAGRRLETLSPEARVALASVLRELADQANEAAETSWRRRKGPMAAYWRAVSTYAKHLERAVRRPDRVASPGRILELLAAERDAPLGGIEQYQDEGR